MQSEERSSPAAPLSKSLPPDRGADSREPRFKPTDKVYLRADPSQYGYVLRVIPTAIGYSYVVFFLSLGEITYADEALAPALQVRPSPFQGHREFLRDLLLIKLGSALTDNFYAYRASRTIFLRHQFKPVLKFLESPRQRLLIADEVGLGKTIEAGIIYQELKARFSPRRVLIVCPSGLCEKWHVEMRSRFDDEFRILDAKGLRTFLNDYRRSGDAVDLKGICSLELLRRVEYVDLLAQLAVSFQLVIIDEAHHLRNPGTLAHALGEVLAEQSEALLLLTATPLQTGIENLFRLMQLIDPGEFNTIQDFEERLRPNQHLIKASRLIEQGNLRRALAELRRVEKTTLGSGFGANPFYREVLQVLQSGQSLDPRDKIKLQRRLRDLNVLNQHFSRTRKREVSDVASRRAHTVEVDFTQAERSFYESVIEFVYWQVEQSRTSPNGPSFAVIMRERQAASCIQALRGKLEEDLRTLQVTLDADARASNTDLDADDTDSHLTQEALERVRDLLAKCRALGDVDTKFGLFHEALRKILAEDPAAKILVFSFFRGTLVYLRQRLGSLGWRVTAIHGGLKLEERIRAIEDFRQNSEIHILLSSEVGAEGLDFQFCGVIFNYDLPWNPMRVEQRIGRLDRFGQEHAVIQIYNLIVADTIEARIFARLYDRIRIFESTIGDLEAILGEAIRVLTREVFTRRRTPKEEKHLAELTASRIAREIDSQEEFEKNRLALMGNDALFEQEVDAAIDSGRYIAPDEVRSLVESFISTAFGNLQLEQNDGDQTFTLKPDDRLRREINAHITESGVPPQLAQPFVQRVQGDRLIPITYDVETARQRKLVEFVTVHHPLARAALRYFQQRGPILPPCTRITLAGPPGHPGGDYAFFIYHLNTISLTPHSTLVPILTSLQDGSIDSLLPQKFLAEIQRVGNTPAPGIEIEVERFEQLTQLAEQEIARHADEREREAQARNNALVEARLASLKQSFLFRIAHAEQQISRVTDERIQRMREAQIRNLQAAFKDGQAKIEKKRRVSIGYKLVACGIVRFVAVATPAGSLPAAATPPPSTDRESRILCTPQVPTDTTATPAPNRPAGRQPSIKNASKTTGTTSSSLKALPIQPPKGAAPTRSNAPRMRPPTPAPSVAIDPKDTPEEEPSILSRLWKWFVG